MTYEEFKTLYPDSHDSQIQWGEMDAHQHVNNTVFFRYFESARMVFWEGLVKSTKGKVPSSIGPILASANCRFRRPLYYPDKISVGVKILSIEDDRFTVGHYVWSEREQALVADGEAVIVSFDYASKKKISLPQAWRDFMQN